MENIAHGAGIQPVLWGMYGKAGIYYSRDVPIIDKEEKEFIISARTRTSVMRKKVQRLSYFLDIFVHK